MQKIVNASQTEQKQTQSFQNNAFKFLPDFIETTNIWESR